MAEFTITKWRCDRCGMVADKYERPSSAYSIRASVDYGTCGGTLLEWNQLCSDCNVTVERQIDDIKQSAQATLLSNKDEGQPLPNTSQEHPQ